MKIPFGLQPGTYWVWWDSEWQQGKYDGNRWDINGCTFSYAIPVGPKWTVPDKPTVVPGLPNEIVYPAQPPER